EAPAQYEAYTDLVPDAWTHLRIDVSGAMAQLYVGAAAQPVLLVHDLKHGPQSHGTVGLWVGIGTDGHFRNLSIRPRYIDLQEHIADNLACVIIQLILLEVQEGRSRCKTCNQCVENDARWSERLSQGA